MSNLNNIRLFKISSQRALLRAASFGKRKILKQFVQKNNDISYRIVITTGKPFCGEHSAADAFVRMCKVSNTYISFQYFSAKQRQQIGIASAECSAN